MVAAPANDRCDEPLGTTTMGLTYVNVSGGGLGSVVHVALP
jgi:hypothetical protein